MKKIKNGTRAQILNELDKLRHRLDFESHKMFICIILSYGTVEGFRTMDDEMIEYQELFAMLNGSNWIHFSEKPKMFFIDVHPMKIERTGMFQLITITLDIYHDFVRLVKMCILDIPLFNFKF